MLRGGMRGWEEEGMEMEHDIRKKILMAKTGERPEYDTSPPPFLCATGVALNGQTNRQLMIKRVGGLLPGGQGLFKAYRSGFLCKGN